MNSHTRGTTGLRARWAFLVVGLSVWGMFDRAGAEESRCADCHFANPSEYQYHLFDWQASRHGRSGVGCEGCHGGDASSYDSLVAHRGVLGSSNPASPTHFTQLPRTCGRCHPAELNAFVGSRHMALLEQGDDSAPSCTTCHSEVGSYVLSTRALRSTCDRCHGVGKEVARPELERIAVDLHEQLDEVRDLLASARSLIAVVEPPARRAELESDYREALAPLDEGIAEAHGFELEGFGRRLSDSRRRAELLLMKIANPGDGSPR